MHSVLMWGAFIPRDCALEFHQPMCMRHVIIQTASMHLDTQAFNNRNFLNVSKGERSYTADHNN